MFLRDTRRRFLHTAALGAAAAGLGDLGFLRRLPAVAADQVAPDPKFVRFSPEIEPLVRLLEDTSRDKLLEKVADRIRTGTSYREVLAALLLAGIRNVQPRPSVGFKFHAVLVVNSAHLASMSSPDEHRWLPIFWALDYFKSAQAQDERENNWTMPAVDEPALPPPHKARDAFITAMDDWDESAADTAVAALARTSGAHEVYEPFFHFGARDFRSIGHKAIYVANSLRTLQCIGWEHAEPVVRSLAYALLGAEGGKNPAREDLPADRPGRDNARRVAQIRADWQSGELSPSATHDLLVTLRTGSPDEVSAQVVEVLNSRVSPQSVWDALLVGAGELLMRQPGIVGLHALTTTNALRYAYDTAASDQTRRYAMLQNAAFLPMFRQAMLSRGRVQSLDIEALEPADIPAADSAALDGIFATAGRDRMESARMILAYARRHPEPGDFITAARVLVFLKGDNSHDYKFSSAVLEDYQKVSPAWRDRYLAASIFNLRHSAARDNPLVQRIRAALA